MLKISPKNKNNSCTWLLVKCFESMEMFFIVFHFILLGMKQLSRSSEINFYCENQRFRSTEKLFFNEYRRSVLQRRARF